MATNVFHIAKHDDPVGEGACGAFYATISAIVKPNEKVETCIANEYIAAGLGRFLGLPLAPGAVVKIAPSSNTFGYASLHFNLTNETLPEVGPRIVVQNDAAPCYGRGDFGHSHRESRSAHLQSLSIGSREKAAAFDFRSQPCVTWA